MATDPASPRIPGRLAGMGLLCLALAACAAVKPQSPAVPVEDRDVVEPAPAPVPPPLPAPPAETTPPGPTEESWLPVPSAPDAAIAMPAARPPAVLALLEREAAASRAGNPAQAAAELERALRITPRDRELWLRLARVRLQQRQWQQAESTALKCLSMGGDAALTRSAWDVVAAARAARGDGAGADAARRRAASMPVP